MPTIRFQPNSQDRIIVRLTSGEVITVSTGQTLDLDSQQINGYHPGANQNEVENISVEDTSVVEAQVFNTTSVLLATGII